MKSTITFSLLSAFAFLPAIYAHGYVSSMTVDGTPYKSRAPVLEDGALKTTKDEPIRIVNSQGPVNMKASPQDLSCGPGSRKTLGVADAMPGSVVKFQWSNSGAQGNFIHEDGPIMTYMASCGEGSCADFDATKAKWFKIQQDGRKPNGDWVLADVFKGAPVSVAIPKTLKAGNYLIRNEIIALHLGNVVGGAEFYVACGQVKVGGKETGVPTASELDTFPGAYKDTDPGIHIDVYTDTGKPYEFPGKPIAKLAASGASPAEDTESSSIPATPSGAATSAAASTVPTATTPATPAATTTSTRTNCGSGRAKKRALRMHARRLSH